MDIRLPIVLHQRALEATKSAVLQQAKESSLRFGSATPRHIDVKGHLLEPKTLKFLYKETKDKAAGYAQDIDFLYQAAKNPASIKIHKMSEVMPGLDSYLREVKVRNHSWLFKRGENKTLLPYLVGSLTSYDHAEYRSSIKVPGVTLDLRYSTGDQPQGKRVSISPDTLVMLFTEQEVGYTEVTRTYRPRDQDREPVEILVDAISEEGVSIDALIRHLGYFVETETFHKNYDLQFEKYVTYVKMYGQQFRCVGTGTDVPDDDDEDGRRDRFWGWRQQASESSLKVEGKPGRCIMDTIPSNLFAEDETKQQNTSGHRRTSKRDDDEARMPSDPKEIAAGFEAMEASDFQVMGQDDFITKTETVLPLHPLLKIFHLHKMEFYYVHAHNLKPYVYNTAIKNLLVLPEEIKEMTEMLVAGSMDLSEDIIEHKSQSTIIGCVGDPGLGKTLLAEVMSEACKKPLYKVQAAQLGLDPNALEKNLQKILNQAQRWNAILMIDEANAYIHSRGHDIRQNAIVGVFLRLFEYFRGICIVTTNMTNKDGIVSFDIDDAIISRMAALFKFNMPTPDEATQQWLVQAKVMDIKLSSDMAAKLGKEYMISGRSIRNLLKLANNWARYKNEELSFKHFRSCAKVIPTTMSERIKALKAPSLEGTPAP